MFTGLRHMRLSILNDKQLSFSCYWYVPANSVIDPIGIEQNSTYKRPWYART